MGEGGGIADVMCLYKKKKKKKKSPRFWNEEHATERREREDYIARAIGDPHCDCDGLSMWSVSSLSLPHPLPSQLSALPSRLSASSASSSSSSFLVNIGIYIFLQRTYFIVDLSLFISTKYIQSCTLCSVLLLLLRLLPPRIFIHKRKKEEEEEEEAFV